MFIEPLHLQMVREILAQHVPDYHVYAYGSRAHGRHLRKFSDLDLAIMSQAPLPPDLSARLREAFSDSDLPYRVDILNWAATNESFRKRIEPDLVPVVLPSS